MSEEKFNGINKQISAGNALETALENYGTEAMRLARNGIHESPDLSFVDSILKALDNLKGIGQREITTTRFPPNELAGICSEAENAQLRVKDDIEIAQRLFSESLQKRLSAEEDLSLRSSLEKTKQDGISSAIMVLDKKENKMRIYSGAVCHGVLVEHLISQGMLDRNEKDSIIIATGYLYSSPKGNALNVFMCSPIAYLPASAFRRPLNFKTPSGDATILTCSCHTLEIDSPYMPTNGHPVNDGEKKGKRAILLHQNGQISSIAEVSTEHRHYEDLRTAKRTRGRDT